MCARESLSTGCAPLILCLFASLVSCSNPAPEADILAGPVLSHARQHAGAVFAISVSPDGSTLATVGADRSLRLWDTVTRRELVHLFGHIGPVTAVTFSPDGETIASGGSDGAICFWSVRDGTLLRRFDAHSREILDLDFSLDGDNLVSSGADGQILLWNVRSGDPLRSYHGHTDQVESVGFLADSLHFYSVGLDGQVRLWSIQNGVSRTLESQPGAEIWAASYDPNEGILAVGGLFSGVRLYEVTSGRLLTTLRDGRSGSFESITVSTDGSLLYAASDSTVRMWRLRDRKLIISKPMTGSRIWTLAHAPDTSVVYIGDADGRTYVVDEDLIEKPRFFGTPYPVANGVQFSLDGTALVQINTDGSVVRWATTEKVPVRPFSPSIGKQILTVDPSGRLVLATKGNRSSVITSINPIEPIPSISFRTQEIASAASFSYDSTRVAVGMYGGEVELIDTRSGQLLGRFGEHGFSVTSLMFNETGDLLAVGGENGRLVLWKVPQGVRFREFAGHSRAITSVALDRMGNVALSAGLDSLVFIWDVQANSERNRLKLNSSVRHVSLSGNAERFLTITDAGSAAVWNTSSGELLRQFDDLGFVSGALSPDGLWVAFVKRTGHVELWSANDGDKLVELVSISPSDWVVATQSGRYFSFGTHRDSLYWAQDGKTFDFRDYADGRRDPSILRTFLIDTPSM